MAQTHVTGCARSLADHIISFIAIIDHTFIRDRAKVLCTACFQRLILSMLPSVRLSGESSSHLAMPRKGRRHLKDCCLTHKVSFSAKATNVSFTVVLGPPAGGMQEAQPALVAAGMAMTLDG